MLDDAALLHRYIECRSEEAFAEVVRRYIHLVYGTALRQLSGDVHRAEDITQSVFLLLDRKVDSLKAHPSLPGWLHTATRLVARDALRSDRRRQTREREAELMNRLNSPEAAEEPVDWDRVRPLIDDALAELDDRDRDAVLLRFFDGRRFAEIGAEMRLSGDAARMRVDRALEKLRKVLSRHGITSTTTALAAALATHGSTLAPVGLAARVASAATAAISAGAFGKATLFCLDQATKAAAVFFAAAVVGLGLFEAGEWRSAEAAFDRESAELRDDLNANHVRIDAWERVRHATRPESGEPADSIESTGSALNQTVAAAGPTESPAHPQADESPKTVALQLNTSRHAAFIIDTSGSMRDPATGALKLRVLLQVWVVLAANPQIEYIQVLDSDGRFVPGRSGSWLPNNQATRDTVQQALLHYQIFSNSNPLPGIVRSIRSLLSSGDTDMTMSVVVLGDEFAGDTGPAMFERLDQSNPADANGLRRVSINAIGFPTRSVPHAGEIYASALRQITELHGGHFEAAP